MKAVILAGGYGKRMGKISETLPKPMTEICKKPVLLHQIEALKKEGVTEFILVVGYLSQMIEEYFGSGEKFGVSISYYRETEPLGTGGALFRLGLTEDFLLCNGDLIFSFSLSDMLSFHKSKNALATLFTHPNSHPYDSTLAEADENSAVKSFLSPDNRPENYSNLCNAGIQIVSPELLKMYDIDGKADFDRDIITPALDSGRIFSYKSGEYAKDMGTPERREAVEKEMLEGIVESRHKNSVKKAVFLDRDGTLNEHTGYITAPKELKLIKNVAEAVAKINALGYLTIVVTNQPVIARGDCTEETLREIHKRLETLLGEKGAYVDGIYYCPHHPDSGYENEISELKTVCNCRKPEAGLLFRAKEIFNIDLTNSFMVGDSWRDIEAGKKAGCKPVYIGENKYDDQETQTFSTLLDFAVWLESNEK